MFIYFGSNLKITYISFNFAPINVQNLKKHIHSVRILNVQLEFRMT